MHGIVHKTLKSYVADRTDESGWETVRARSEIEPTLYLPVSYYPDEDVARILETLAAMSGHDAAVIERDFGRTLAPALVQTFNAHFREGWELFDLLDNLERVTTRLNATADELALPTVSCTREDDRTMIVAYRSNRGHEAMARGVLEGLVDEFDADAVVTRVDDRAAEDGCSFRIELTGRA